MTQRKVNEPANPLLRELKRYLIASNVSQEEAAKDIGVSYITLNRWMNGHTKRLHGLTISAIQNYLDIKELNSEREK